MLIRVFTQSNIFKAVKFIRLLVYLKKTRKIFKFTYLPYYIDKLDISHNIFLGSWYGGELNDIDGQFDWNKLSTQFIYYPFSIAELEE